jgi:hypothetical protein
MSTKSAWLQAGVLVFAFAFTGRADITYNVNRTIGTGSVTGTITANALGVLAAANITDWNLVLTVSTDTFNLTGPLSGNDSVVYLQGVDVTATSTQLLFDFGGSDSGLFLFQDGLFSGLHYYCDGAVGNFACFAGETVAPISVFGLHQVVNYSGVEVIGSVPGGTVPEPSSVLLMSTMLLGVGFSARKRIARSLR